MYIRPSSDLRSHYKEVSDLCRQNPVAITVNGREDTVILSHEDFTRMEAEQAQLKAELALLSALAQAEEDIKAGKIYSPVDARNEALRKYGI